MNAAYKRLNRLFVLLHYLSVTTCYYNYYLFVTRQQAFLTTVLQVVKTFLPTRGFLYFLWYNVNVYTLQFYLGIFQLIITTYTFFLCLRLMGMKRQTHSKFERRPFTIFYKRTYLYYFNKQTIVTVSFVFSKPYEKIPSVLE